MRLFVSNFPWATTEDDLVDLFEDYGATEANIIPDRDTGKSRGFGFVEIPEQTDGERAIHDLDGQDFRGRQLRVNEARARQGGRGGSGGDRSGRRDDWDRTRERERRYGG